MVEPFGMAIRQRLRPLHAASHVDSLPFWLEDLTTQSEVYTDETELGLPFALNTR